MIVTPIAHTVVFTLPESIHDTELAKRTHLTHDCEDVDLLAEFAGRACYQAWSLPNPGTAANEDYLRNIIEQGHFSVLEHGSVTFYIEGVSRALTHELIRHRHLSFSELSQRYVDMSEAKFIHPPAFKETEPEEVPYFTEIIDGIPPEYIERYESAVRYLVDKGYTRKQAREAARAFMPNATETKIVVTGNLRAWRDMLHKRWHVAADAEIRQLAGEILNHLRQIAPHSVQDIPEAPFQ